MNPNATITDEQFKAYLKKVRDMVEGPYTEWQKEIEVTNTFPEKFYQSNIDNDIYRFSLPVEYGGWGLNEKEILQVQEEFSRGPSGMRMHMHYASDLNWRILDDFGQPEVKEKYMPLFQDKTIFTNFALTEKSGGTGADLHSTAVWDEEKGKWILNGEKWLISHTDCSQFSYVICVTDPDKKGDDRLSAFFVPMDKPGFELVPMPHMMGCRGSGHTGLKFTNVELEPELMLGKRGEGMKVAMHSLAVSRVHIATSNLGISQRMFEMSIARARDRVTFGKPIIKRQAIRVKLANMQMMIHALRCCIIDFCDDFDLDPEGEYISEKAAICKLFSIDTVRLVSDEMLEIFGGDGYFEDSPYGPTELLYRDCRAMWLEEGAPTVQRITIAKGIEDHDGTLEYQTWIAGSKLD